MKYSLRTMMAGLCLPLTLSLQATPLQNLTGHVPAATARAAVVGPLASGKQLPLAISLPWRNAPALTNFLKELSDPGSPNFRQYLTPSQFTAQFGPTVEDYEAIIAYARSNGLTVTSTSANRALVGVRGPVAAINKALHVTMTEYQHPTEGRVFYAPDVEPSLDVAAPILHIGGLDNFQLPKPMLKLKSLGSGAKPAANGTGPGGLYMGSDFRNAYLPGVTLDGAGQSVALVEFDGYYPGDITAYEHTASLLPVPITNVLVNSSGTVQSQNGDAEVSLDIDMAISMAINLQRVMVYETEGSAEVMVNQIALDDVAKQISCSWSFPDASIDSTLQEYAAQGQTFFSASGDGDAYPTGGFSPSDSPYATAVGGTTLTTSNNGSAYGSEVVWNAGGGEGTGGGISSTYLIPYWQTNINMITNQGSTTHRDVPDVAMNADNVFLIYENGAQIGVVGTSCAAPLWAGFNALANQLAAENGMNPDGYINPAVYGIAQGPTYSNTFHDITVGNNESSTSPSKFAAEKGYDLCTGWGTPTGSNMLYALGLPEPLRLTPLLVAPFAGPVGGPFGPSSIDFELVNGGVGVLNWGASATSSDFQVSQSSGSIPEGGNVTVSVTLQPVTTSLGVGVYTTTLQFTNLNDQYVQSRTITLLVAGPPVIETQPTNVGVVGGEAAQFHVGMATNSQFAFQWWKSAGATTTALSDGGRINGSQTTTLNIADATNSDEGSYFVIVSNAAGMVTSSNATLTLAPSAPVVAVAPVNVSVMPGASAYFSVVADGTQPITYQWQLNGTNLFNTSLIHGVTTPSLTLSNVSAASAGMYSVVLANALGTNIASAKLSVVNVTAPGTALTLLSSFAGGTAPQNPVAGLLVNASPFSFYGTSLYGGADGFGCVYRMASTGTMTPITSFAGNGSCEYPVAGLVQSGSFFYGVSAAGGNDDDGTVFRVNTSGQLTVLHSFSGEDGNLPESTLFLGKDGAFYGASTSGGIYGLGNVFRINSAGVFSNLVSFDGINGSQPLGTLVQDASSNLYGTSQLGGFDGLGNIFMITPTGQVRTLISFTGGDGAYPVAGLTLDAAGNLYGTTHDGGAFSGGEVFVLHPDGTGDILYEFGGVTNDGVNPYAQLALGPDGNFYGSTEGGGEFGLGTIFVISPDGNLTTLASFDGFQGNDPAGLLLPYQGSWYGVTYAGGFLDLGASFKFTVSGPLQITGQPSDDLVDEGDTALFQVATYGSAALTYQWRMDGTNLSDGNGISGSQARVLTISDASQANVGAYSVVVSNVYGAVTSAPGLLQVRFSTPEITEQPLDESVLVGQSASLSVQAIGESPLTYQWLLDGQPMTNSARVSGANSSTLIIRQAAATDSGSYSVIVSDSLFNAESSNAVLAVTPIVASGTTLQFLHSFSGGDGAQPYASLIQGRDGKLYGAAVQGGKNSVGCLFDVSTNGVFSLVYSFSAGDDGARPFAGLAQGVGADDNFYGVASSGGSNSDGTLFRVSANHAFTPLYSFQGSDGEAPEGALVIGGDGNLYGTTAVGGEFNAGSIFSATTKGAVKSIYSFTGFADGDEVLSGLTLGSDGNFYGTAYLGGTNGFGSVYKTDTNGTFTLLHDFAGYDGADPVSSLVEGPDGKFYGTAFTGGADGYGTVYSITTNGEITTLYSFDYENSGAFPNAGLTPSGNGGFIGAVQQGGPGDAGGIYEITTNGVWTPLIWFTGANGAAPLTAPVHARDGYFYGTTYFGGVSNLGGIYRFQIPAPPQITVEPSDVFVALGSSASFSVTAVSATPLTYQWYFDGAAISGATNAAYTVAAVSNANVGTYFVTVSNLGGATNSRMAALSIISPLIGNGGFETGDFTDWTLSGNSQNISVQTGAAIAHSGSFGARLASSNSLGYLTTTAATSNGVTYQLSLWLDSPDGAAPNEFAVLWNGGIIFDGTNLPTLGWTNLQFTVTATNSASTIGIGARDDTSFLAADDVSLTPAPSLQTTTVTQTPGQPGQVTFDWSASPGLQYQVQYKNSLTDPVWLDFGGPVIANGGPVAITDFLTNTQRFYRVVLVP